MPKQQVGDVQLFYDVEGEGETVLLLHGLGSSARDWEDQLPALTDRYRVMLVDFRGHGQSDKPAGPYSIPQFTDDLVNLMNTFRVGSAHIVGLSLGGMVAFQLATSYPERVRSLVIVNSGPEVKFGLMGRIQAWIRFLIVRFMGMRQMGQLLAPRLFPDPSQEAQRNTLIERWAQNDKTAYMNTMRAILNWKGVAADLGKITQPVLFVAAEHDYTPVAAKQAYAKQIKRADVEVIKGAHHGVPQEMPDAFNRIMRDFIDTHTDRKLD